MESSTKWKPGQSGNPKGRPPKGQAFADCLRDLLDAEKKGKTTRQAIAEKAVDMALKGDLSAIQWITDRTDGKLTDKTETTGELIVKVLRDRTG